MISCFTPSHDPKYLPQLYESLTAQDNPNWEWVLLQNGESRFAVDDKRVKMFEDASGNRNVGFLKHRACKLATGDVLLELDHDDELMPGALSECQKAIDQGADFVYSNTVNHDVRTNQPLVWSNYYGWRQRPVKYKDMDCIEAVSSDPDPQSISRIWYAPNHFRAWRRDFYERIGSHDPTMKISDDHDLICRSYLNGTMVHVDKPLYFYRVHGENTWLKHQEEIQTTMWMVHDKYIYQMAMKWAKDRGLRCLDLCGGLDKPDGYESVDLNGGDITADLNQRWPFEDNSVGLIRAHDAIEHIRDPIHTMNEAYRVLAHGGFFLIQVPSSEGVGADCDPTHVSRWNWRSFRYYTESAIQRYITHAGAKCRFQKIKVENKMLYDGVLCVIAHLVAIKAGGKRFYGELLI